MQVTLDHPPIYQYFSVYFFLTIYFCSFIPSWIKDENELKKLQHGSSVKMIQEEYNVGKSTIYDLRSDKEKILQYAAECESANLMKTRKTMKPAKFHELDRVLYEWFKQRRSEGIPISGFILWEKAREFHQTMDLEELLLYYIIIIFGEKFDYPVNSIIRTGAGPVESGLPSFYCTI